MRIGIAACGYADGYPRHAATGYGYVQLGDAPVVASLFVPFLVCASGAARDRLARRRSLPDEVPET